MKFLKPTKVTWIAFVVLVTINVAAPFIGFALERITRISSFVILIEVPLYQFYGPLIFLDKLGIAVEASVGPPPNPTLFGWVITLFVNLSLHYIFASMISYTVLKVRKNYWKLLGEE